MIIKGGSLLDGGGWRGHCELMGRWIYKGIVKGHSYKQLVGSGVGVKQLGHSGWKTQFDTRLQHHYFNSSMHLFYQLHVVFFRCTLSMRKRSMRKPSGCI